MTLSLNSITRLHKGLDQMAIVPTAFDGALKALEDTLGQMRHTMYVMHDELNTLHEEGLTAQEEAAIKRALRAVFEEAMSMAPGAFHHR